MTTAARATMRFAPGWYPVATVAGLALAVLAGPLVTLDPQLVPGVLLVCGLVAAVWWRPAVAAYLLVGLTPLLVGIDRGVLFPYVRPNEGLDLVLGAALTGRWLLTVRSGGLPRWRLDVVEWALVAFATAGSVVPVLWLLLRGQTLTGDDVVYALVLWKYVGVYALVRASVRTVAEIQRCLVVSLFAGAVVGSIAILQSLHLFGVTGLLAHWYTVNGNEGGLSVGRGSSTLAFPAAVADLMILNLAIALAMAQRAVRHRRLLHAAAALFALGALSSGEFSSALGLVVGAMAIAIVTRQYWLVRLMPVMGVVGAIVLWPVIERRLQGFRSVSGLPVSWTGRLHNLQNYFWPQLFSHNHWVLGVRPSARVSTASRAFGYIWIESGYTWLLWGGGIPLLLSFVFVVVVTVRRGWRLARDRADALGVAGAALVTAMVVGALLMLFDPHITYRGSADALFALFALTAVVIHGRPTPARRRRLLPPTSSPSHPDHTRRRQS